jgi:hypothetical protein
MNRIIKWAEDTGFKVSTEKTKAIMFSRRKQPITTRPTMNIWAKGDKIAVSRTENVVCEAGMTTLTEMRKLSNTKAMIRVVTNKEHPIRPFCTNPSKIDEYALRPKTAKPLFIRLVDHRGTLQKDMRKIEIYLQNLTDHHGQQLITDNMISNYA